MQQASVLNGRQMMLLVVVGLHALVISVLMTMRFDVDRPVTPAFKPVTEIALVERPPPVKPELTVETRVPRWNIPDVPRPDIQPPVDTAIAVDLRPQPPVVTGADDALPGNTFTIAPTELISRATRSPDDYYPSASIAMQEEGVSVVRVCVGPTGRIEGRPAIQRSSRSRRLDAAAIRWAAEALEFTPATRNGAAVPACKDFRVVFNLR
jgi:TonB family protein